MQQPQIGMFQQNINQFQQQFASYSKQVSEQIVFCGTIQQNNQQLVVLINGSINLVSQQNIQEIINLQCLILSADLSGNFLVLGTEKGIAAYNLATQQLLQIYQQYQGIVSKVKFINNNIVALSIVSFNGQQLELANPKQVQTQNLWGSGQNIQLSPIPKYKIIFINILNGQEIKPNIQLPSQPSNGQFYTKDSYLMIPINPNYGSGLFKLYKLNVTDMNITYSDQNQQISDNQLQQIEKDFTVSGCCFNIDNKVAYIIGYNGQLIKIKNISVNNSYSSYSRYTNFSNNHIQVTVEKLQFPIVSCCSYINDICLIGLQNGNILAISQLGQQLLQNTNNQIVSYLDVDKRIQSQQILIIGTGEFQNQQSSKLLVCCNINGTQINQLQLQ